MPKKKPIINLAGLSESLIESLKEISGAGKILTIANITGALEKRKDITELLERANVREKPVPENELESLKTLLETSENKRRELFREIRAIEEQTAREKDFHKRLASALISLSDIPQNEAFHVMLEECRTVIHEVADIEEKEKCLKRLKDRMLREDIGGLKTTGREGETPAAAIKKPFLRHGEREPHEDVIQQLKNECANALDELQSILGENYRASMHLAKEHVTKSRDMDSLLAQKTYILSIIESFVRRAAKEKEDATIFLREVSERLIKIEKDMLASSMNSMEMHLESNGFNDQLETQIHNLHENVLASPDFESLRSLVTAQLSKISSVLKKHRMEYADRIEKARQESADIKKNFHALIGQVIDKNKTLMEEIQRDPLTEIFNRRTYEISLAAEFNRYIRYRKPFTVIFFDVDHFKSVNDRYGHEAGDRVLRAISRKVRNILRKPDIFARYGGEEFVVILPETGLDNGIIVAEKIREIVEETTFEYEGKRVPITISLGITEVDSGDADPSQIALRADKLLYLAKSEGRNRVKSDHDMT